MHVPHAALCGAAVILLGLDASGRLSGQLQSLWGALSAWTATLLFCCQPIAQLAANFVRPEGAASLSLATVLLAMLGNCMMVPRALMTRDVIWLTGTVWGSLAMGWGNLLSMAMAKHAHGCGSRMHACMHACMLWCEWMPSTQPGSRGGSAAVCVQLLHAAAEVLSLQTTHCCFSRGSCMHDHTGIHTGIHTISAHDAPSSLPAWAALTR